MTIYSDILSVFKLMILWLENANIPKQSQGNGCFYKAGELVFPLKAVFLLLPEGLNVTYSQFRSQLYVSGLNEDLMALGYKVDIYQSTGKVDTTLYCLTGANVSIPDKNC